MSGPRACTYMVTGKGLALDDDLVAFRGGFVEAGHEQVQIGRQGLHDDDLAGQRAHDLGGLFLESIVEVQPGRVSAFKRLEMAKDAFGGPGVEVSDHVVACAPGLQAERVSAQIDGFVVVVVVVVFGARRGMCG